MHDVIAHHPKWAEYVAELQATRTAQNEVRPVAAQLVIDHEEAVSEWRSRSPPPTRY